MAAMETPTLRHALRAALWLAACVAAQAAPAAATEAAAAPAASPATGATPGATPGAAAARAAEPSSGTRVIEDDRVRIEETRVRGQLRSVTVRSKLTGGDYEIIVGPGGRDPSQNAAQRADGAGQRAWSLLRF
jgi:hypothetical protein